MSNQKYLNNRMTKVFPFFLGLLLLLTMGQVGAEVEYVFTEDFSDETMEGWRVYQNDWRDATRIVESTHTFHDGVMDSPAIEGVSEHHNLQINVASRAQDFNYGAWRLRASIDSSLNKWNFWVFLVDDPVNRGEIGDLRSQHVSKGMQVVVANTHIGIDHDYIDLGIYNENFTIPEQVWGYDVFHQYDIIRTPVEFFVFVDGFRVANDSMDRLSTFVYPNFVSLTIGTEQGSNTKFDHLQITEDYEGVCLELTNQPDCWGHEVVNSTTSTDTEGLPLIQTSGVLVSTLFIMIYRQTKR